MPQGGQKKFSTEQYILVMALEALNQYGKNATFDQRINWRVPV